jgi:hypothetical protein
MTMIKKIEKSNAHHAPDAARQRSREFEKINAPGLYVEEHTGALIRLPAEAIKPGHGPLIAITGATPWRVRMISEDPALSVSHARALARELELKVGF